MLAYIIIFLCVFSFSNLRYISLSRKEIDTDIDDICYFLDEKDLESDEDDIEYVKPCEPGYYCHIFESDGQVIGTCEKYSEVIKKLNDECSSDYDCDSNLVCTKDKCIVENSTISYSKNDLADSKTYYYCPNYLIPIYNNDDSDYKCEPRENYKNMVDMCNDIEEDGTQIKAFPDYFKICANQTIIKSGTNPYQLKNTSANYIGSIEDGVFVEDPRACKSGYALNFYGDKNITQPTDDTSGNMFLMCVTVNEVQKDNSNCYIKYSIGEKTNIYNTAKIQNNNINSNECEFIMTKIELFKEYTTKMNEIKDTCTTVNFYDEPFTCGNDELRKLWYFYNNIDMYLLYKNDEDIINYLVQKTYPLYGVETNDKNSDENNDLYLNIKYFIFLLFLLSL